MSNFLSKGLRLNKIVAQKHMKEVYKILGELDKIAPSIYNDNKDVEFTEDNIKDIASKYTDRVLAKLEIFLLLGKLQILKDNDEKNNTQDNT